MLRKLHVKLILALIVLLSNHVTSYSQCAVSAPGDVSVPCGGTATLSAPTNAVTYTVVTSSCTPVAISGATAFPTACDDCVTAQIPIGFNFNFYGNIYNTAVIQSNGILGFGPFTFTGYNSFSIPAGGNPNNYIAGIFADIDIRYGGTITYQTIGTAPNRRFVVSYDNVVPYNLGSGAGTGTASFQIVINENGSFQVIISQFSANWYASTSGALATSGAENIDGTYAFPVPGRNATDWPGITPAAQDCTLFNPQPCIFQRWQQGATVLTTNPILSVSPTTTTTYTAYWNCGGTLCNDDTVVNVIGPSITAGTVSNNTNCSVPNGNFTLSFNNFAPGTYTLNYLLNGSPQTQTITVPTTTTIAQSTTFNTGSLASTDTTWIRNTTGTACNGSAGTSYYLDTFLFTPSASGTYTFNMCTPGTDWDGHASLYQNAFNAANPCGTPANFVIADDDANVGGNCENDPSLVATLTAGVTYYLVTTSFGTNATGNYEWTYTGPGGATIGTSPAPTFTFSNLSSGTYSNFSMASGTCGTATLAGPFTITSPSAPTTVGTSICPGGSGTISLTTSCGTTGTIYNSGATFNTGALATTDSSWIRNSGGTTCNGSAGTSYYYDVVSFSPLTTGSYTFSMCTPGTDWDGHASLYQNAFNGANPCGTPANFIIADDDTNTGGNCENDALLTATLTSGVTYYLVTTSFSAGLTGNYEWTFTGPGSLNVGGSGGVPQWYTAASGGAPISTANPFNPVGVSGSGLANTNTPGNFTYYAACSTSPNCRTATVFAIRPRPTASITGSGTICNSSTNLTVTLTGTQPWTLTYTNGSTPVTISGITSSPYTLTVSPSTVTTYTLTALSDANCTSIAADLSGSVTIGGKIWLGTTNSNWSATSNWSGGVLPTSTDCVIIPPTANNPIISGASYVGLAGTLRVLNGAVLTVNANNYLRVTNFVNVEPSGNIIINDDASLVQVNNPGTPNSGNIQVLRTTNLRKTDYVYWSSPVTSFAASAVSPLTSTGFIWKWNPTINGTDYGIWVSGNENMTVGKGYIIRGPNTYSTTIVTPFTTTFTGVPNNGNLSVAVSRGTRTVSYPSPGGTATPEDDNWNLIGNPYPSAINALTFLTANANLDGNVRLWTHGQPISTSFVDPFYGDYVYNYSANDYINYNSLGSTPPGFNGRIASCQSFFVQLLDSAPTSSTVSFTNTMRSAALNNSQFYRGSEDVYTENDNPDEENYSRIWLNIANENEETSTTLIGYAPEATYQRDRMFDAFYKPTNILEIFTLIDTKPMIIQGRPAPVDQNDLVPVGFTAPQNGIFSIGILQTDGIFSDPTQMIYLEDMDNVVIHDLRTSPYSFAAETGNHLNRFRLRYTNTALNNTTFNTNAVQVAVSNQIHVISSNIPLKEITVYDVLGRKIAEYKNVNALSFTLNQLLKNNSALLLEIKTTDDKVTVKKVIY